MDINFPFDNHKQYLKTWRKYGKLAGERIINKHFEKEKKATITPKFEKKTKTFWLLIESPSTKVKLISAQFTPPIPFSRLKIRVWFYESDIPLIDKLVSCKSTSIQGTIVKCYRAENKPYEQSHQANPICGIEYCIYDCDQLTIESSIEDHLYNYIDGTISHINLINSGASNPPNFNEFPDEISEYELMQNYHGFFEGKSKKINVNRFERNIKARNACIQHYQAICRVCSFDFSKTYGEIGENFIHVHHIVELAHINQEYEVNPIEDLIPVCPNCHAMLHRRTPAMTVDELKAILESNR